VELHPIRLFDKSSHVSDPTKFPSPHIGVQGPPFEEHVYPSSISKQFSLHPSLSS